eukprot:CAMPEP_0206328192 /NCGR_PEP_ID=MMETSP0106_2-20121207/22548_1 /ASSEMBLY_ACC=CAM_ASM_000206 /TAXON_ID=81532 /ORGANISM="Acanthoeca-like sp., Strain 10tr" /LENGTH=136 /DNA_ID=CAMNT_0053760855 /DNA_START=71 /DNA_END=481 /DNA_ORIENTATION=+
MGPQSTVRTWFDSGHLASFVLRQLVEDPNRADPASAEPHRSGVLETGVGAKCRAYRGRRRRRDRAMRIGLCVVFLPARRRHCLPSTGPGVEPDDSLPEVFVGGGRARVCLAEFPPARPAFADDRRELDPSNRYGRA